MVLDTRSKILGTVWILQKIFLIVYLSTPFLGRRQAVRHRVLGPAFGGSNPPAPAKTTRRMTIFNSTSTGAWTGL